MADTISKLLLLLAGGLGTVIIRHYYRQCQSFTKNQTRRLLVLVGIVTIGGLVPMHLASLVFDLGLDTNLILLAVGSGGLSAGLHSIVNGIQDLRGIVQASLTGIVQLVGTLVLTWIY
ncbi:MAG: hypothetical protein R3B38_01545 [Patescibacteria group bacterium]